MRIPIQDNFDYARGSVAFWIKSDVWADDLPHGFFKLNAHPRHDFGVFKHPDGWEVDRLRGGINPDWITVVAEDIPPNVWHLIVFTYQGGEFTRLYLDGNFKGQSAEPYPGDAFPATA